MPRAIKVMTAGPHDRGPIVDTLIMNLDQRRAHRGFVFTVKGTCVELDLEPPVWLHSDDALILEDGSLIEIVAEAEPLIEVRASDLQTLARIAWVLGDRHVPVQILGQRLRMARDPAIQTLLSRFAVKVTAIDAPFDPEGGAYSGAPADDGHRHDGADGQPHSHHHHTPHPHTHDSPAHNDHTHEDHTHDEQCSTCAPPR